MQPTETPTRRQPLSRDAIVSAAVALADRDGVEALTMRGLAKSLGYEVMSLYNHVANKNELLSLMIDAVTGEVAEPTAAMTPMEAVRAFALSTRAVFVNHQWAADVWLRHLPGPNRINQMELLLRTLAQSGLSPELAHHGFHAVTNHVVGYTLQETAMTVGLSLPDDPEAPLRDFMAKLSEDDHPHTLAHVYQHIDGDTAASFELVLDLILDGLVKLNQDD